MDWQIKPRILLVYPADLLDGWSSEEKLSCPSDALDEQFPILRRHHIQVGRRRRLQHMQHLHMQQKERLDLKTNAAHPSWSSTETVAHAEPADAAKRKIGLIKKCIQVGRRRKLQHMQHPKGGANG